MAILRRIRVRIIACVAAPRVMKAFAPPAIRYTMILALALGAFVALTTAAVAGPGPTPTPICLEPPSACTKNS
jgi:hypothetical protein